MRFPGIESILLILNIRHPGLDSMHISLFESAYDQPFARSVIIMTCCDSGPYIEQLGESNKVIVKFRLNLAAIVKRCCIAILKAWPIVSLKLELCRCRLSFIHG
jgi:hypothetical protein